MAIYFCGSCQSGVRFANRPRSEADFPLNCCLCPDRTQISGHLDSSVRLLFCSNDLSGSGPHYLDDFLAFSKASPKAESRVKPVSQREEIGASRRALSGPLLKPRHLRRQSMANRFAFSNPHGPSFWIARKTFALILAGEPDVGIEKMRRII